MIRIELWENGIEEEINRLAAGPSLQDLAEFESILVTQFRATQAAVHVITGSLRNSGQVSSTTTETSWEGTITYGGPSVGSIFNPVKYAEYEREKEGNHDFLAPARELDQAYVNAMNNFLRG